MGVAGDAGALSCCAVLSLAPSLAFESGTFVEGASLEGSTKGVAGDAKGV